MRLARWAVPTAIGILLAGLPVATDGRPDGIAALAQGTDRLPGGVEHGPMGTAPSMSAPSSLPPPIPPPAPIAPAAAPAPVPLPADSATVPKPAGEKAKKPKKAAPAAKSHDRFRSAPNGGKPVTGPGSGSSGDDSRPGGVEHAPGTADQ